MGSGFFCKHFLEDKKMRKKSIVLIVALVLLLTANLKAVPITFEFTGVVSEITDPESVFDSSIIPGVLFNGSYTFDSDAVDQDHDPSVGIYSYLEPAPTGFSMSVEILSSLFESIPPCGIGVRNSFSYDAYSVYVSLDKTGFSDFGIELELISGKEWLDSDDLPLTPPPLSEVTSNIFDIYYITDETEEGHIRGQLSTLTLIPEPATLLIFTLGAVMMRRKQ